MNGVLIPEALRPLLRLLAGLTEYPRNAQVHSEADVAAFAKVLQEFGWTAPLIAWPKNGTTYISAGHLRYRAARLLGLAEVPVVLRPEWSERQFRAATIADNQWTKRAVWDFALLKNELVDLDTGEFDLTLTGFNDNDLKMLVDYDAPARTPLDQSDVQGEVYGTGRFIIVYADESEKVELAARLGVDGERVVYKAAEVCRA